MEREKKETEMKAFIFIALLLVLTFAEESEIHEHDLMDPLHICKHDEIMASIEEKNPSVYWSKQNREKILEAHKLNNNGRRVN